MNCKLLLYSSITLILLLLHFSCNNRTDKEKNSLSKVIRYRHVDSSLVIGYFIGLDKIPDSLANYYFKDVLIENLDSTNYEILFKMLKPDKVNSIRFYGFDNQESFSANLSKFKQLKYLHITGNEIKEIKLASNLNCKLKRAGFYSPELKFPDFDSSFEEIEEFYYSGNSDLIPKWIENLDSLTTFEFGSKHLKTIACDICKMKSIWVFDISESSLYKDEREFFERNNKYNVLDKFKKCKPDLEFKSVFPN